MGKQKAVKKKPAFKVPWASPEAVGEIPNVVKLLNEMGTALGRIESHASQTKLYLTRLEHLQKAFDNLDIVVCRAELLSIEEVAEVSSFTLLRRVYGKYTALYNELGRLVPEGYMPKLSSLGFRKNPVYGSIPAIVGYLACLEDMIEYLRKEKNENTGGGRPDN